MTTRSEAEALQTQLIEVRRAIHKNPELGFEEFETARLIKEKLIDLGISFRSEIAKTGIVATIQGKNPGKKILIRADMDALPLTEDNDVEFKSQNIGKMHACGHDTHVSMLLGAAEILKNKDFNGTIHFVFQPAEETSPLGYYDVPGGAAPMILEGGLGNPDNPDYDVAIALHISGRYNSHTVAVCSGPSMGSADEFQIKIKGSGGHGSSPHKAIDPVFIASEAYSNVQGFLSRTVNPIEPFVFTIGKIEGGSRHNIISELCNMEGTLRTLNSEVREVLTKKIPEVIRQTAEMYGGDVEVNVHRGYPVGVNDETLAGLVEQSVNELYGPDYFRKVSAVLGAEDFFEFRLGGKIPVCMFWLGTLNEEKGITAPNHSNYFDVDEDVFPMGTAILVETALKFLASE